MEFTQLEKQALSQFKNLIYRNILEFKPDFPAILITNTQTELRQLNPEVLRLTQLIVHPNSGYDNFALDISLLSNIPVLIGHEIRAQAVAEYTLAALFQGLAELPQHLSWNMSRRWDRCLIKDLPIWIFGYGHIGKILSKALHTLGASLTIIDPYQNSPHRQFKTLDESQGLDQAKVIIACCGLNRQTKHLFSENFFKRCGSEILFINPARGKLVNEGALRNFLANNPKAFAFLDVFENEPFGPEWHHHPQVWKTSHIAGVYKDLDQGIINFEVKVLNDFFTIQEDKFLKKYQDELLQNKFHSGELT
jgi:D-3-phosphoglycerate dehydrogenase